MFMRKLKEENNWYVHPKTPEPGQAAGSGRFAYCAGFTRQPASACFLPEFRNPGWDR